MEETLAENSVVYGGGCDRRKAADRPAPQTLQIDFLSKVLRPFLCWLIHIDAIFSQVAYLRSTRCCPTIITWRSQQRSQLYRPRPDTRKVFRTDTHREQTHNRREWTDRLDEDNRRDRIQGTQILTLENIAYILVEFNLFTYILKSISLVEDAASTTL